MSNNQENRGSTALAIWGIGTENQEAVWAESSTGGVVVVFSKEQLGGIGHFDATSKSLEHLKT